MYNDHVLYIQASENTITLGFPLDLIAVINPNENKKEVIRDVEWIVYPANSGRMLDYQIFMLNDDFTGDIVNITCRHHSSGLMASREFNILRRKRLGSLVHFIKSDQDYTSASHAWDLWTYNKDGESQQQEFTERSDFGPCSLVNTDYVIIRKNAWGNDWSHEWLEQSASFTLNLDKFNYYIIYGDDKLYTDLEEVVQRTNPRILFAAMDTSSEIRAHLSHLPASDTVFTLYINQDLCIEVVSQVLEHEVIFTNLPANICPYDLLEIRANKMFTASKVTMRNYLDQFINNVDAFGAVFSNQQITLRLWAPSAYQVELLVYSLQDPVNYKPSDVYPMSFNQANGTYCVSIDRPENENKYYLFRLYFHDLSVDGKPIIETTYAVDPYAQGVGINGKFGVLIDLNSRDIMPKNWQEHNRPHFLQHEDAIIYEMHIRDFTILATSGVDKALRGKFLGVIQSGCYYTDEKSGQTVATGIDSLVELGVTHVHLLPIFDFSSVDETELDQANNRNWGYDPQNYNAPEGSYSLDPYNPSLRIFELREMVSSFHAHGIRVIMDVVYNHMTDTDNLNNIVPHYYFRSNNFGKFTNGSGCGNELASERLMARRFILDSVLHWVNNYKIDGLRFDLMELIDLETMKLIVKQVHAIDASIIVYGEPWKGGVSPLQNGTYRGTQKNQGFSIFNDVFRDAIRGNNLPGQGFINGEQHNSAISHAIFDGLKGSINGLTDQLVESVNYIDAHDNYTLWDHIEKSQSVHLNNGEYRLNLPENPFESSLVRQYLLALGVILTAQGIPFLHGGVEILRTKQGDHNSYKSNDLINAFYWEDKFRFKKVFDYVAGLIRLRKEHSAFRMSNKEQVIKHLNIQFAHHDSQSGVIIMHFGDYANDDKWQNIIIIFNATTIDNYDVNSLIPILGEWNIVVNHEYAGVDTICRVASDNIPLLRSHSLLIMYN